VTSWLEEADHLLEIGTGWGAMAEYAARHYGCRVTTTTLSQEQYLQPSGSPAPGCRIALRYCSAIIATSPGSTTSWSQ
jgi:hypothetical protein